MAVSEANVRAELFFFLSSFVFLRSPMVEERTKERKEKKNSDWPGRGATDGRVDENNIHSTNSTGNINTFAVLPMREIKSGLEKKRTALCDDDDTTLPLSYSFTLLSPSNI